jgi:hypothetical protein
MEGEHYCESPEALESIFRYVDPPPAPKTFCVIKPIDNFSEKEMPELVAFFARSESLSGLHQLATFVTNDPEVVMSPWGAACGGIAAWPLHYLSKGLQKAVIGGWDPSARRFYKTDELSFTIPWQMFTDILRRYDESFLTGKSWKILQKKIASGNRL